ncbi:MAG: enolase, partial [Candidatus Pacebacteria bacterium]|nr:enolase [Candidatus Paceibacterota bacterium]
MSKIKGIKAREILDSRGNPTIEVSLETEDGVFIDSAPSGASTGEREAVELRDGDEARYSGKGVLKAVQVAQMNVFKKVKGYKVQEQKEVDLALIDLDGTDNKRRVGGNTTTAISLTVARAGAKASKKELFEYIASISNNEVKLPSPCFNVINGGKHAGGELAFQEFMINFEGHRLKDQIRMASETYHKLKEIIALKYGKEGINVGDEGGFTPLLKDPKEALDLIVKAAEKLNYLNDLNIFLDVAASEFYDAKKNRYVLNKENVFDREELVKYYKELCANYPIKSIEDPFDENDFEGFRMINQEMLGNILIIGDDLTTTNIKSVEKAYSKNAINGLLVKINQIGTVSEAIEAANLAKSYNFKVMVSHRSGETMDDFI